MLYLNYIYTLTSNDIHNILENLKLQTDFIFGKKEKNLFYNDVFVVLLKNNFWGSERVLKF